MDGFEWAFKSDVLNDFLAELEKTTLSKSSFDDEKFSRKLIKAGWLASLLAESTLHEHRQKALLFAALCKLNIPENRSIDTLCYSIFARTGTLPAAMHLRNIINTKLEYSGPDLGLLSDEFSWSYTKNFSELAGGIVLTDFQKTTSTSLSTESLGVISAPTSAGKSFVIHEFVKSQLSAKDKFLSLFIVPTKALISQVCSIYRKFSSETNIEIEIYSSVPDDLEIKNNKAVFALTQERCIRLLSSSIVKEIDFIFIDEIQALEDGDRGAILEYVIQELKASVGKKTNIFAAGPFISNGKELGEKLFSEACSSIETEDTPVSQILTKLKPVKGKKQLEVIIVDPAQEKQDFSFNIETNQSLYSRWHGSQTKAICDSIRIFSTSSPSIVYAPGPGTAQNWAKEYLNGSEDKIVITKEISDLISYIKESIHPQCSLVECLKNRVAYHHGSLPDFVREEIEELLSQRELEVLFCTSTLLEGVNLPADKIFIVSAKKSDADLSDFEFRNLIGRAGRLDQHLCGMVYCVDVSKEGEDDWIEKYRKHERKEVRPTVSEKLVRHFELINSLLERGAPLLPDEDKNQVNSSVTVLRSRYLKSPEQAQSYLESKDLGPEQQSELLKSVGESIKLLSLPHDLALKNPSIDPFLQDELYKAVLNDSEKWMVRRERGFSTDLERVFKELDKIFHIVSEIAPRGNETYYRNDLLAFAKLWLRGKPFKSIVIRALPADQRSEKNVKTSEVDKAIKRSMNFISRDISYVTAKYFSVLADMLRAVLPEDLLNDYMVTLNLPVMLELGSTDPKTLSLITACVPRGAALQIAPVIPESVEEPVSWLTINQDYPPLQALPSIYHKILKKCGIWK